MGGDAPPRRAHLLGGATLAAWALAAGAIAGHGAPPPMADAATSGSIAAGASAVPISLWPLSERARGAVHDAVGHRDGVATGNVSVGQVGQGPTVTSYAFDGTTATVTVSPAARSQRVVAASAWLRAPDGAEAGTIIATGNLRIALLGGHIAATLCGSPGCGAAISRTRVDDGAWHAVAASVARGRLVVYVDGVRDATSVAPPSADVGTDSDVLIGAQLRGNLDQVAIYATPIGAAAAARQFRVGACPQAAATPPPSTADRRALPALPLRTSGRFVVDAHGHRVKLAGVNWYGAEELDRVPAGLQCQSIDAIAAHIVRDGFNVVRLPWATDTWIGAAPPVAPVTVAANPQLRGLDARAVFDAVIAGLARHGLMVIVDNHVTRSDWCCDGTDGNALWWAGYDPSHPPTWSTMTTAQRTAYFTAGQQQWLTAWATIAQRYSARGAHPQPAVVGADLRNEPRTDWRLGIAPTWGVKGAPVWQDWPRAATLGGNTVLHANPNLLIAVEGTSYAGDLRGVATHPITLALPHRLIYSVHEYGFGNPSISAARLDAGLGASWGWLLEQHKSWTTPVWVGEFGTCHPDAPGCDQGPWWKAFTAYLHAGDIDWTYWSINGTGAHGSAAPTTCDATPRFEGCPEGYGVSDATWAGDASASLSRALRDLAPAWQH